METVGPVDRAVLGAPQSCPVCGGWKLGPAFGERTADDGTRQCVIDPNWAICGDCGKMFKVRRDAL
jgi:hypothetical protein